MNDSTDLSNLPELIRHHLGQRKQSHNGCDGHREMAPYYAYGRHRGPTHKSARQAAVMVSFIPRSGSDWTIPLTLRPTQMVDHGGQVSLPGGRSDSHETAWRTACREFGEELGCTTEHMQLIGEMSPLYVFASRFQVTPLMGVCSLRPSFHPNPDEVAELLFLPVRDLIADDAVTIGTLQRGNFQFEAPGFKVGDHFVWGATAMILGELRFIVREILQQQGEAAWFM